MSVTGGVGTHVDEPLAFSASETGLLAYRSGSRASTRSQPTWFDREGTALASVGPAEQSLINAAVSPDGLWVAVARCVRDNRDLWLLDQTQMRRFTFDAGDDVDPLWSPDGRQIVFGSNRAGAYNLCVKPASGAGNAERLIESPQTLAAVDWSPDGRFLLYLRVDPVSGPDLWVRPMNGDPTPWVFLQSPFRETWGSFSPDGNWVAYQSDESGRNEIWVRAFVPRASSTSGAGQAGARWQVSTEGGSYPKWSADGREIYYLSPDSELMAVRIGVSGPTPDVGATLRLFQTRAFGGSQQVDLAPQYDVSRDGRFLINSVLEDADDAAITLVQHWVPPEG